MTGRTILITGGFGALGQVVAETFAHAGDRVVRVDHAPAPRHVIAGSLDLGSIDLTDEKSCVRAVQAASDQFGPIDVLVNIAGGFTWETVSDGSIASWQRMFDMNVLTALNMVRASLSDIIASNSGRIINIGAGAALKAQSGMGAYAASKAGVHRLTESLAAELGGTPATVNAVLPSIIDTPANRADMPDADTSQWVQPQAIADVILFLASGAARSVSGALIPVTRGTVD